MKKLKAISVRASNEDVVLLFLQNFIINFCGKKKFLV
jgi:hypothetical protein